MIMLYFWIFVGLLIAILSVALYKPEKIYEYPYFMAVAFASFVLPQAISLIRFPGGVRDDGVADVLLMTCLCLGACWVGYQIRPLKFFQEKLVLPVNPDRMFHGGIVFIIISLFFSHMIDTLSFEERGGSTWTGVVTIYLFFASLIFPALVIVLSSALHKSSFIAWLAVAASIITPIEAAIFSGRRENTAQLILTIAITLYYQKHIKPPRLAIIAVIVGSMLAIPATATYRQIAAEGEWDQLRHLDLIDNFNHFINEESTLELRNAAFIIEATSDLHDYEYGAAYWDNMVFRFVPAQILGKSFKNGLMIYSAEDEDEKDKLARLAYSIPVGSTLTGMGDSFKQFGWFGCLFFALLGILFKNLYQATWMPHGLFAQMLYVLICCSAMRTVTHQTVDFLPGFTYNLMFLGVLYLYAHEPVTRPRSLRPAGRAPRPSQNKPVSTLKAGKRLLLKKQPGKYRP